ncbi:MAG TPA: hypothetical protein VHA70_15495 [Bauldia sp.]|nr:hypothetical protein [Bauldia sp.]
MAEYYAVLSKAVAGLDGNSADARRAVYDKARNALIGQLKAIDPPLPTAEISRQRLELEEAIRRVERETSTLPSGSPVRVAGKRPAVERPPAPSPQDVFRRAIQEAEDTHESPRMERAALPARADDWSVDRVERPPPKPAPQYLPSQGYVEEKPRGDEPRLAPDYDYDWDPKETPQSQPRAAEPVVADSRDRGPLPASAGKVKGEKRGRAARRSDMQDMMDRPVRPSRLPAIILLVLIIAMLGGLGALAYSYRAQLSEVIHSFDGGSGTATPPAAADASQPAPTDTSGKDTDRLLPGQAAAPATDARVVTPSPDTTTPTITGNSNALPDATTNQQQASAPADADSLVAQHATLYEEPVSQAAAANGVVAINAAVTWSYVSNGPEGPEIVGNIDVPDRKLKIKLTVRRNSDQTLPASHVVEVVLDVPSSFPGKGIRDVPRVVLKPSEDARGQPLIGASAKVADGFFWIALSGADQDETTNLKLLKEREWFDLPLLYESGQRAILTFEKGTPGDRVFERALTAWAG